MIGLLCSAKHQRRLGEDMAKKTIKKTPKTAAKVAVGVKKKASKQSNQKTEAFMMNSNKEFEKMAQSAQEAGQEQMDALVKSSTILAKGMEDIFQTCMGMMQSSGEKSQDAAKSLMGCKTVEEFTQAQNKLAQTSYDEFVAGATKVSEMSAKVCTESAAPINDQLGKTMKKAQAAA